MNDILSQVAFSQDPADANYWKDWNIGFNGSVFPLFFSLNFPLSIFAFIGLFIYNLFIHWVWLILIYFVISIHTLLKHDDVAINFNSLF